MSKDLKFSINKPITFIKSRLNLMIFLVSLSSIFFILLRIINLNILLDFSELAVLEYLFNISTGFSTIFIVLFVPSYPIFFIIFKHKNYNFLEKLSLTIIFNFTYYVLIGYLGNSIGIPMTSIFFFLTVIISFLSIISYIIFMEFKSAKYFFLRQTLSLNKRKELLNSCSLKNNLKKVLSINAMLLILFLLLICIFQAIKYSYFYGTDAWLHVFIVKKIKYLNYLPIEEYHGSIGYHLFGAIIHFFSGIDILQIPRFFPFYTFFISALIFYNLLMRIFKNQNLALFGVFILEFFAIGFDHLMYQFWPTTMVVIQCLLIFFILYVRLENLIKLERPTKKQIVSDIIFTYVLIALIYSSSLLTHSLNSIVFLASFLFLYLLYFVKDYRRGIDFVFLCSLLFLWLVFNLFGLGSEFFNSINIFNLSWYIYIIGGIGGIIIVWKLQHDIKFTTGRFKLVIMGKKHKTYKLLEDKVIYPLVLLLIVVVSIVFVLLNVIFLNINMSKMLLTLEAFIIGFFGAWGYLLFHMKPKGKVFILWCLAILFIYGASLVSDIYSGYYLSGRILILISPVLAIGFIAYFYKLMKLKTIGSMKVKLFVISLVIFSFFAYFNDQLVDSDAIEYSMSKQEVSTTRWLSDFTNDKNVIITKFGKNKIFFYYDYPFEDNNESLSCRDIHYFLTSAQDFFKPDTHVINGTNILQELKNNYSTDVYIWLHDFYEVRKEWDVFGRLTSEDLEAYYNLPYLNKISSTKTESGKELPFYWVI